MSELYQAQCRADRAHHQQRVVWLTPEHPKWSDGTLVEKAMRERLLTQSQHCLTHPADAYNSCHCQPPCQ